MVISWCKEWQEANAKWETDDCNTPALIKVVVHQNQAVYVFKLQSWDSLAIVGAA
jgi:hypothetical protein